MNKIPLECHQRYERMDFQRKAKVRYTFFTLSVDHFNVKLFNFQSQNFKSMK